MKITVENLGTIHKGEISLDKELTIFTGENNSGKSYMSYLVYGVLEFINVGLNNFELFSDDNFPINLATEISMDISRIIPHYSDLVENYLHENNDPILYNIFAFNTNFKFGVSGMKFSVSEIYKMLNLKIFEKEVHINLKKSIVSLDKHFFKITGTTFSQEDIPKLKKIMMNEMSNVIRKINHNFVPAERTAINLFYNDIVKQKALENEELISTGNITVETINKMQQQGKLLPRSPKPITDYIYFCYDFRDYVIKPPTKFADLATELENLLGGGVGVSAFGDLQFQPKNETNQIPLYLSSSLVKSLSGVVIYLRHLAQEGDILMIDEPEINLHPKTQILIARFLAKMVNRGIRIVVSTHSDYIIKELNNLIMLKNESPKAKKLLTRLKIDENAVLEYNKVAVYSFENHTIRPITTSVTGFDVQALDEQIIKQGNESRLIYETLYENES